MSDETQRQPPPSSEAFDLEIFNLTGEVQHTEINFDQNFDIIERDVDGSRRC